jgi:3-oxoacyl-[acyl-carrier-protein] synthase II
VLTGLGLITAIGKDSAGVWESLRTGRSGIHTISLFDPSALPTRFAGSIPDFDAKDFIDKKDRRSLKVMARTIQLAVAGAQVALDDSAINKEKLDPARFGVEFGASLIASELEELGEAAQVSANCQPGVVDLDKWGTAGLEVIQPLWMLKYLPNMLACHVSILHNAQGPNNSITESDAASLLALGEAYRILGRDGADFFLVGGAESRVNPLSMVRVCLYEPLSKRNDAPEKACRPFERDRDGIVIGEGAGVLVLEELEHAKKRGAKIYAEVVGFGAAFDRKKDGSGLARAIRAALTDAGIGPEDIDHINAHGLSSVESDVWEAHGVREVFGNLSERVPVWATKSYLGNLGAGAGTVELAMSVLALQHGAVPATLNYDHPDPSCPIAVTAGDLRPLHRDHVLKVNFTPLGQCAAIVIRKW